MSTVTVTFTDSTPKEYLGAKGAAPMGEAWFAVTDGEMATTFYPTREIANVHVVPDVADKIAMADAQERQARGAR